MSIVVEDGTNVEGANSYITLANARAFALARGAVLSTDDTIADSQLVQGFDFIEALENRFGGCRTFIKTAFPRVNSEVNSFIVGEYEILPQIGYAQTQVAMSIEQGFDPAPVLQFADIITKEKIGPLETTFAMPMMLSQMTPQITSAMLLLRPFFGGTLNQLTGVRI